MKITGYRELVTQQDWQRVVGDVNGVSVGTRTDLHVLILTTDTGYEGISVGASRHTDLDLVFPAVEGEDPRSVTALYDRMLARVFKSGHAGSVFATIGAVDHALWDLKAKMADEPLWRMLGGRSRFVPGYASGLEFGLPDDEVHALYQQFADAGFSQAKLKGGRYVEDDIRRLQLVREILARNSSQPALMLDANECWHRSQAVRHVRRVEAEVELSWVEEPVRRWDAKGLADVRKGIAAGVASGENLTGLEQYRPLFAADALDVVQFNGGGGITHALRVAASAQLHDLPVSPVGFIASVAHATTVMPNHLTIEVQDLGQPVGVQIDQTIGDGGIILGDAPGSGVVVDEAAIGQLSRAPGWRTTGGPHVRPSRAGLRLVPEERGMPDGTDLVGA